jgi:hypothetical protein
MSDVPTIHCTKAELAAEEFWAQHLDPIARAHGIAQPTTLNNGWPSDPDRHELRANDGRLLAVVLTRPNCPACGR